METMTTIPAENGLLDDLAALLPRLNRNLGIHKRPAEIPPLVPDCGWDHGEEKTASEPVKYEEIHD
jgi:hypothetical protein